MKKIPEVFRSGTDALLLAAYALRHKADATAFIELGCGDGLATRLLAEDLHQAGKKVRALGVDIQAEALSRAANSLLNCTTELQQNIYFLQADLTQKKTFGALCTQYNFSSVPCVIANPPYYKAGRLSPHSCRNTALHQDNNALLEAFCAAAKNALTHHGWFFSIYAAEHMLDMCAALQKHAFGLRYLLPVHTRPEKPARWVLLAARKGAAQDLRIEPSLCLYAKKKGDKLSRQALKFCPHMM